MQSKVDISTPLCVLVARPSQGCELGKKGECGMVLPAFPPAGFESDGLDG